MEIPLKDETSEKLTVTESQFAVGKYLKAHLKYRDTTARETVANDREKCALKWLFVELVVETDTLYTNIELVNATLENDARVQIPKEPPSKAAFK